MKMIVLLSALAGSASVVLAQGTPQAYPLESEIRLEVWNGTSWGNTVNASPGQQVEYRVVINYTGPRTDLLGLADSRYQVSFSNADNTGPSRDTLVSFPENGTSIAPSIFFSSPGRNMLPASAGQDGGALTAYGRIGFGALGQMSSAFNRLTNFRHGGGAAQAGAPAGSWLRVAGEFVTNWPLASLSVESDVTAATLNSINRGVSASQLAPDTIGTTFVSGVTNLVVFRHAVVLSTDVGTRQMEISLVEGSLLRAGKLTANPGDDRRYIQWHDNAVGPLGTYRTSVAVVPATIVIPTPGVLAVVGVSGMLAARRRR